MNKLKALFDSYIDKENYNYSLYNEIEAELKEKEEQDEILRIIKEHKLLNYILKNPKCAGMYHLSEEEIEVLKEVIK